MSNPISRSQPSKSNSENVLIYFISLIRNWFIGFSIFKCIAKNQVHFNCRNNCSWPIMCVDRNIYYYYLRCRWPITNLYTHNSNVTFYGQKHRKFKRTEFNSSTKRFWIMSSRSFDYEMLIFLLFYGSFTCFVFLLLNKNKNPWNSIDGKLK